jgi:hypothetical protein
MSGIVKASDGAGNPVWWVIGNGGEKLGPYDSAEFAKEVRAKRDRVYPSKDADRKQSD